MIRKPITCPTCGDPWKRVIAEHFVRLGPPTHECRACWTSFATGEKEWQDMDGTVRIAYFLQNIVIVMPLAVLMLVALTATYFFGDAGIRDLEDYFIFGSKVLLGLFVLLNLWSALMILLSRRRADRPVPVRTSKSAAGVEPEVAHYPQGRPNPRPKNPSEHRGVPL
jgi:hypothetical protein